MENLKCGPRLSDKEFFSALDDSVKGIKNVKELYESGDVLGAYRAFGGFVREFCDKDKYFSKGRRVLTPEFTDALKEKAERAMKHIMVSVGVPMQFGEQIDWYANPTYNNYKEWTWQLSRHDEIGVLAQAYRATGNEDYAKECISLLLSWIHQAICVEYTDSPYHCDMAWRTIEAGIRMQKWDMIIYSVASSPHFTDEAAVKIFKSVYEHGMRLSSKYTHGNWLFLELSGMAHLVGELRIFKKCAEWTEEVIKRVTDSVAVQVYPDTAQYELAPSYQGAALGCAMSVERVLSEVGISMPDEFYDRMRENNEFHVKMRMANGEIPPINDSPACSAKGSASGFFGNYGGSDLIKWLMSDGKEGSAPDYNSCILPYAGLAVFRTGWGDGDVSALFDGGKFGRDHSHEDRLNFLLYSAKRPLVYEFGTYAYDDSPMRTFCTQSHGHNVVTVDGLGQNRISNKIWDDAGYIPIKEDLRYFSEGDIEYAFAYYNGLWGNPQYDGEGVKPQRLAIHMRSVIMIKGDRPADTVFAVLDRMIANGDKDYRALWHLNVDEVRAIDGGFTCPELTVLAGGFDKLECFKGVTEPKPLGWISRSNIQGDYYAAPQLVFERRGSCESFVTLFAFGAAEDIPVTAVECDNGSVTVKYKNGKERKIDVKYLDSRASIV